MNAKRIRRKLEVFDSCRDTLACLAGSSLEEVGDTGVMLVTSVLDYKVGAMVLADERGGIRLLASRGIASETAGKWHSKSALLEHLCRSIATPTMVTHDTLTAEAAQSMRCLGLPDVCLVAPVSALAEDREGHIGIVLAAQPADGGDSDTDVDTDIVLLDVIASFLAGAIALGDPGTDQARVLHEAERSARSLRRLETLSRLHEGAVPPGASQDDGFPAARSRAESEFLANVSHEIRTQLTAILGFAEVLLESVAEPQNVDALKTIWRNGEHLLRLTSDILDFSKIEAGQTELHRTECSPCQIVADVVSLMQGPARAKHLSLEIEYAQSVPEKILSDPVRLRQILVGLVNNAIKFTEAGRVRLIVGLCQGGTDTPRLEIRVIDTGVGIPADQISMLFTPFALTNSPASQACGGTGLGLTITKRLAQLLGGDLTVESTVGEGSSFILTVETGPLDQSQCIACPSSTAPAETPDKEAPPHKHPLIDSRILLAEDGPDNQRLISFVLWKAGADASVAENGQVAYDLAMAARESNNSFDVILMDMRMPVLDGYEATKRLRAAGYTGPIVALTANAMKDDRQKCLDAGCDEYLSKPINRKKLISLVAEYTKKADAARADS